MMGNSIWERENKGNRVQKGGEQGKSLLDRGKRRGITCRKGEHEGNNLREKGKQWKNAWEWGKQG